MDPDRGRGWRPVWRRRAALEGLDVAQATAATRARVSWFVGRRGALGSLRLARWLHRYHRSDQLTRPRDGCGLGAARQQTIVPDPMEPVWQNVDEEPADELGRRERHGLVAAGPLDPVVLVAERDAGGVGADEPGVGDRDPVGVAGQIGQHLLGPGKRPLAVDEPLGPM